MSRTRVVVPSIAAATLLALLSAASPTLAGPPLLCHPFNIENARSLPWSGVTGWRDGLADYNVANLGKDTDALLTPATPILVRMETMRRAAIYASRDVQVASRMVSTLLKRTAVAENGGQADAMALLDAAYFVEALRQLSRLGDSPEFRERAPKLAALVASVDGYALVTKSLSLRPQDAPLEFAAALIASDKSRSAYDTHLKHARAGAATDRLLSLNIGSY